MTNLPIEVKTLPDNQRAIYTNSHFDANHIILKFNGVLTNPNNFAAYSADEINNLLQIGSYLYLYLHDISKFIRHSCNPNCGIRIIGNTTFLLSIRHINPGEELTFDYSMTSTDTPSTWQMNCHCGSWNCRKEISGFAELPSKIKEQALSVNIVPNYLKESK